MTVRQLLNRIDSAEMTEWQALYILERQEQEQHGDQVRPEVGSDASMHAELAARADRGLKAAAAKGESARR